MVKMYICIYRVIQNDCRGFNNLSYTIHLRQVYAVAPMDQEILSFLLWCAVCSSYAFLRLERSLLRWRRTAVRRRFVCLHFMNVGQLQLSSGNSAPNSGNNHQLTIPLAGGMHSFKRQSACVKGQALVGRLWQKSKCSRSDRYIPPRFCYIPVCKVCNKNLGCSIK